MTQVECDSGNIKVALPPDTYNILIHSTGSNPPRIWNKNTFNKAKIGLLPGESGNEVASFFYPVYGIVIDSLEIKPGQNTTMQITPALLTKQVYIHIDIEHADLQKATCCYGSVSNILPSCFMYNQSPDQEERVAIPITFAKNKQGFSGNIILPDAKYKGQDKEITHVLTLDFTLDDGQVISSSVELNDLLAEEDKKNISIRVKASEIEVPGQKLMYECMLKAQS